jgi:hypothetical protein
VWVLVTGFRTRAGLLEFLGFLQAAGTVPNLQVAQVEKIGLCDIGLGQESHPDGSGPLLGPLPDQASYQ